jgi:acyl-CoA thioesterase-1
MHDILKKHEIRDIIAYLRALNKTDVAPRVPAEVRNAGVGGHTSADLLSRLQDDVLDHHPSTVVLMVGTNDRLNSRKLITADRYRANLATLIAGIRAIGAKVLLVTPPPCVPEVLLTRHDPAAYADQAPNARMAEIRDIMLATRAPLVDFHAQVLANSALLSKDGVHLTGDGYIALAEAVAQGLHEHRLSTRQVVCLGDSLTASPYPGELRSILRGYSIGLSMYSLRQLFADGKLTALDYPAFARKTFGITEIDIWDGALPADRRADPEMYRELRKSADSAGCNIFLLMAGSLNASKPDDGKRFFAPVQHTVLLGADYLRIFLRAPTGERTASITQCIDSLRPLADFAQTKGITLVIEPGSSKATEDGSFLADLAAKMRHPGLALMPDFGKLKQDPYGGTEAMLPHSPVISAKSHNFDSDGEEHDLDYPRLLKSINDAQFRGIIAIEYEGKKLGAVDGVRATQRLLERLR